MTAVLRNMSTCCLLALLFSVMACAPERSQFSTTTTDIRSSGNDGVVVISPPKGPPGPMADLLAQSVVAALIQRGYAAQTQADAARNDTVAGFSVSGTAEALDVAHAPTVAALHWVLYDDAGKEMAYLTQGVRGNPDSWAYGSPAMLRIVGAEAAADFSAFLGPPPNVPPPSTPSTVASSVPASVSTMEQPEELARINDDGVVTAQPPVAATAASALLPEPPTPPPLPVTSGLSDQRDFGLWLDDVTGAPGNGNAALSKAIYSDLKLNDLPFAMTPGLASHYIQGVVDVAVRSATQEHVTIMWVVSNADGQEIGRVSQRNDIVRGSLHGDWGDTAIYAARGGLEGILAILERDLNESSSQ